MCKLNFNPFVVAVVEFEETEYVVSEEDGTLIVCLTLRLVDSENISCPVAFSFTLLVETMSHTASE